MLAISALRFPGCNVQQPAPASRACSAPVEALTAAQRLLKGHASWATRKEWTMLLPLYSVFGRLDTGGGGVRMVFSFVIGVAGIPASTAIEVRTSACLPACHTGREAGTCKAEGLESRGTLACQCVSDVSSRPLREGGVSRAGARRPSEHVAPPPDPFGSAIGTLARVGVSMETSR